MASILLNCSICPKRPNFSDTSHLLTHIGSKGHLAHLHKLQVRSHQEIAAGHQLAAYNQWYQEHSLGQLLSERMQHKNSRTAATAEKGTHSRYRPKKEKAKKYEDAANFALAAPSLLPDHSSQRRREMRKPQVKRYISPDDDDGDYESSPVKRNRGRRTRMLVQSPLESKPVSQVPNSSDADCLAEEDLPNPSVSTPNDAKLKGVIWPGMDLFDAATYEMRRRRNQKKDSSVLRQMERTSASIEPTEVIYSPGGTMKKERYIDGMVDESSPLQGETPIPKQPVRRKRQALGQVNLNIPRLPNRREKHATGKATSTAPKSKKAFQQRLLDVSTSSTNASFETALRFCPTEAETAEFQETVKPLRSRRRAGSFAIFNDHREQHSAEIMPSFDDEVSQIPFQVTGRPQLPFLNMAWLQPQSQPFHYTNGTLTYRANHHIARSVQEVLQEQENIEWMTAEAELDEYHLTANPLGWQYQQPDQQHAQQSLAPASFTKLNGLGTICSQLDDPFACSKNPLSAALEHFGTNGDCFLQDIKQRPVSPDGTVSDHEAEYVHFTASC